ncbi:TlpA family protein disulfide reductase [bacterium]|nr:TlpA family protein disulfide reductase [bacterium]MBU1993752.1 TlpA family protein disulfide reductase [bacterium]
MLKKSILPTLLTLMLLFQACSDNDKTKEANEMVSVSEYVLTTLDNNQQIVKKTLDGFTLESSNNKVVLFDIFATWCPPCKASATHLTSLQEKYKDDLIVIGITIEEKISNNDLIEFRKNYNANYILVNSDQNRRLVDAIASSLKLGDRFPIPLMAMYKDGKLVNHYLGAIQEEFIESDIKKALGK